MPRDILSEYGEDAPHPQAPRAGTGGVTRARDVMGYRPPAGPIGIGHKGPGLGGANLGNCGTQGPASDRGDGAGGGPVAYDDEGMGTNRKG